MGTLIYTDLAACILQFLSPCKKLYRFHFTAPFRRAGRKGGEGCNIAAKYYFLCHISRQWLIMLSQKKSKSQYKGLHLVSDVHASHVWRRRHIWKQQVSAGKRQFTALSQATFISLVRGQNKPSHPHQQHSATYGCRGPSFRKITLSPAFQAFLLVPGSNNDNYNNPHWLSDTTLNESCSLARPVHKTPGSGNMTLNHANLNIHTCAPAKTTANNFHQHAKQLASWARKLTRQHVVSQ